MARRKKNAVAGFVFDGRSSDPFRPYDYEAWVPALQDVPVLEGEAFPLERVVYENKDGEGASYPANLAGRVYPDLPGANL